MDPNPEHQGNIHQILEKFDGIERLKDLFWTQLNYNRVNQPISRRGWTATAADALVSDPLLFAAGGTDDAFHVIYAQLNSDRLLLTQERPIISHLLRNHNYALFIFSNRRQENWHFVNVKYDSDYDSDHPEKRRLFRRITINPYEKLRTASERIVMLDLESISPELLGLSPLTIQGRHDEAFDVEAVTKRFFEDYKSAFKILMADLTHQTQDSQWAHDYALQFLNRCMFLYFIQRKRWLGEDTAFLRTFWDGYQSANEPSDTFVDRWLKVLFFEAFNRKFHGGHRHFSDEIRVALSSAPYLNGGLFTENDLDKVYDFVITDGRFSQIFDFLERYNFTITEDSPLDQEVAVDPEMIGKVYESLVNVSSEAGERGDAGIFYTPRTEIDLMCRLALVDRLTNQLGEDHKDTLYEAIFAFEPDDKAGADQRLAAENLWKPLDACLKEFAVVDPACGSGSFLVGMLYILDDLRNRANQQLGRAESGFGRKKAIIGQNLYGVDVMEWACHVAELRLWLALIIDAEFSPAELHVWKDPLLPHFSFNIRCGDSLVEEGVESEEWRVESEEREGENRKIPTHHLSLISHHSLPCKKGGFDIVIGNPPYVRHEHISDPITPREKATTANKKVYKAKLARSVYQAFPRFFGYQRKKDTKPEKPESAVTHKLDAKSDLYIYFYFHGLSLLNSKGSFCFITSNSWLDVGYGKDLQEFLLKHCHVKHIIDNQARRSFADADVNTVIVLFSAPDEKSEWGLDQTSRFVTFKVPFEGVLDPTIFEEIEQTNERRSTTGYRIYPIFQQDLLDAGSENPEEETKLQRTSKEAKYIGDKWGGRYLRAPDIFFAILEKGRKKIRLLKDLSQLRYGIKTGVTKFFYLTDEAIKAFNIGLPYRKAMITHLKDLNHFTIQQKDTMWVLSIDSDTKLSKGLREYIKWGESQGFNQRSSLRTRNDWYVLPKSEPTQIVLPQFFDKRFAFLYSLSPVLISNVFWGVYPNRDIDASVLCALMNTTLFYLQVELFGRSNLGKGVLTIYGPEIEKLSLLTPDWLPSEFSDVFMQLATRKILPIFDEIHQPDRRALDGIVFDALSLTQGERDGVYEAVINLVESRLQKAKSLSRQKEIRKRRKALDSITGIWIGLPEKTEADEF